MKEAALLSEVPTVAVPAAKERMVLTAAAEKYFANCEARGLDPASIRAYRLSVDAFVQHCGATYVDECHDKQPFFDFMGWLRRQPVPKSRHSNPPRVATGVRIHEVAWRSCRSAATEGCAQTGHR
jgi:hypothetical protein